MATNGERQAQASLMPPEVRKPELGSPYEVRQQLLKMLGERELGHRVSLQVINGQVSLNGDVSRDDVELVSRMLSRFGEQFETSVPVLSRVSERNSELPFKILQIVGGPHGHVVLEQGNRLFVGDEVEGLRLVLIDNTKVVFDGKQRFEVRW
jgi:type III secretion protein D